MLKFLSHSAQNVEEGVGWWSTWEDPDPLVAPAKERATYVTAKIEIDQDQFSRKQFSELHLQGRVERERSRERWVDSGSDSTDTVYNRRRKVMLRRAEHMNAGRKDYDHEPHSIKEEVDEYEARRQEQEHEREVRRIEDEKREHLREICGRNILPEDRKSSSAFPKYLESEYKGDYYYNRSYEERFPRRSAGSSNDHVRQSRSSHYQKQYPNQPLSPRSIKREANMIEETEPRKLEVIMPYTKFLMWKHGECFLYARDILKNLTFKPLYYCQPKGTKSLEYNSVWLPKTRSGEKKSASDFESLNPLQVWQEDAWTFVRRMYGDDLTQKLFYQFITATWILLDIDKGKELRNYQDALIDSVFGHRGIEAFVKNQKTDTSVTTYDGYYTGFLAYRELELLGNRFVF